MTAHFTDSNTEGFTAAQLEVLNEAADRIIAEAGGDDLDEGDFARAVCDRINNLWTPDAADATVEDIVEAYRRHHVRS